MQNVNKCYRRRVISSSVHEYKVTPPILPVQRMTSDNVTRTRTLREKNYLADAFPTKNEDILMNNRGRGNETMKDCFERKGEKWYCRNVHFFVSPSRILVDGDKKEGHFILGDELFGIERKCWRLKS